MIRHLVILFLLLAPHALRAQEYRHVGDYLLQTHVKITGGNVTPVPIKPIAFHVYTDGVRIRVSTEDDADSHAFFDIYRSDGIGRRRADGGGIEMIPGLQGTSRVDGVLRHLRLSAESLTITTFPGVSDQTIVSHAVAAVRREQVPTASSAATP